MSVSGEGYSAQLVQLKESIDAHCWSRGSYSFMLVQLNILDSSWQDFLERGEESEALPTLVHEYVHYMQHFTTTWGFTNFFTCLDAVLQSFLNRPASGERPQVPLKNNLPPGHARTLENYATSMHHGVKRDENRKFIFAPSTSPPFELAEDTYFDPYLTATKPTYSVTVDNCWVPLMPIVLAENMALAASYLAAGLPLAEVERTISMWGLQYTAIYRTLRAALPAADCLRLTYELTEAALLVPPYSIPMADMLRFVQANRAQLAQLPEEAIIAQCLTHIKLSEKLPLMVQAARQKLDGLMTVYQRYAEQYSLFQFVLVLLENMKVGLEYRQLRPSTYAPRLGMDFINRLVAVIKSPLVQFRGDGRRAFGRSDAAFTEALAQYNGLLTLHHTLYYRKPVACPLQPDGSLCTHPREKECAEDALAAPLNPRLKHCLLYNMLLLTGVFEE